MMLRWFETASVRSFAAEVCEDYSRLRKSVQLRQDSKEKRSQRTAKLVAKVREFEGREKLNFFRRAIFLQELRSGLSASGAGDDEVSEFVNSVMMSPLT
ncbi:MAG TPA: hypothetical protein PLI90_10830 [Rhodocyclaceae bacterium]|jgi:hypothetical protein|nr:hypothetical protein [Rhodocyclaceae bacterium]